jgi:hypothetical protein
MGLVFAVIAFLATVVVCAFIEAGNVMRGFPNGAPDTPLWPTLGLGIGLTGLFVWSHFAHWSW